MTQRLIPFPDIDAIRAAGLPFNSVDSLRHCYKKRHERGLEPAFVKIGDKNYVDPDKFHELARAHSAAKAAS